MKNSSRSGIVQEAPRNFQPQAGRKEERRIIKWAANGILHPAASTPVDQLQFVTTLE